MPLHSSAAAACTATIVSQSDNLLLHLQKDEKEIDTHHETITIQFYTLEIVWERGGTRVSKKFKFFFIC
jgi:hypothetical protein